MTWSSALPPHHTAWLSLVVRDEIAQETRTTCHDCVMCDKGETASRKESGPGGLSLPGSSGPFFDPGTKCCTYLPELANFLVGGVLIETPGPGRRSVIDRIEAGSAVTPLGLGKTPAFKARYGAQTFGLEPELRCPHYLAEDRGRCGVWLHRNAICATWFCHFDRGVVSKRFWATTAQYLKAMEAGLARWCVLQLDPSTQSLDLLLSDREEDIASLSSAPDPARRAKLWGRWHGKEQEFYRACADLTRPLTPQLALELAGPQAQVAAQLVVDAHSDRLSPQVPDPLAAGGFTVTSRQGGTALIQTYSPLDPIEVADSLIEALVCFDGQRSNAEAVQEIRARHGLELGADLLRGLVDFGLLQRARSAGQAIDDALAAIRALRIQAT